MIDMLEVKKMLRSDDVRQLDVADGWVLGSRFSPISLNNEEMRGTFDNCLWTSIVGHCGKVRRFFECFVL